MNDDRRIAQLEALLARIRSRSRPPRASPYLPEAPPPPRPSRPGLLEIQTPLAGFRPGPLPQAPPAPQPFVAAPSAPVRPRYAPRPEVPVVGLFPERPLEPMFARPEGAPAQGTARSTPREPPPMEVVELEVDPDPSIPPPSFSEPTLEDTSPEGAPSGRTIPEPLESRSRLVSAPPVPLEPLDAMEGLDVGNEPPGLSPSDPTIEVAAAEVSRAELDALEDSAPSSSRRPISLEAKMSEPDDDAVPLHTPPPESGRLPAALPHIELAFEPAAPERSDVTLARAEAPERSEVSVVRVEEGERNEMSVVRAEPPEDADVALFVAPPRGAPGRKTFGDLLDDALSL